MENGQNNIITKLFASFTELEQAINSAKTSLQAKESVPEEVLNRLNSYDGVLIKALDNGARLVATDDAKFPDDTFQIIKK